MGCIAENITRTNKGLPEKVKLVAVSKFRPVEDLQEAYLAGQRRFAESRPLEFETKVKGMPQDVEWHFIGHLQTNKLKHVLPYVSMIHSIDSIHLLDAIEDFLQRKETCGPSRFVKVLLEVHVAKEETKQGFLPEETESLLREYSESGGKWPHIKICGLMGMASHTDDVTRIDADFKAIESLFHSVKVQFPNLTDFTELSIGMSDDWTVAIKHSATLVRIGSAIFCRQ